MDDAWREAAVVSLRDPPERGWEAAADVGYELSYVFDFMDRNDAAALGVNAPVSLETYTQRTWPPYLTDLLPQGYGRQRLLRQMGLSATAGASADWALLCAGAGNPVGNARIREAAERFGRHVVDDRQGFTWEDIVARDGDFIDYLATHGAFIGGSSGVQGEWPKLLLAEGRDGLYYLDHALPDHDVAKHWLVKFAVGTHASTESILRLEALYMPLARQLGLHVHGELRYAPGVLFIPRFDREVEGHRVLRHAQESVASLCEIPGFGDVPSHNTVCRRMAAVCTHPLRDVVEYLRRDVANVALGNKDNHARNTAIQRRADGFIGLTPVFDFAPMMLHPDGIARRMRWDDDDVGHPVWRSAVRQAAEAGGVPEQPLLDALTTMLPALKALPANALALGVDEAVVNMQRATIENVVRQIEAF
ncbi:MAG: hypothetical protein GAK28_01544 [Luteibacter sp.]|nr:MAG: hypothetical protein GAK28_01544 [Luteibacter sp.]